MAADLSGWDLTQLLRVPSTYNRKYPDVPVVEFAHFSKGSYDPTELAASVPVALGPGESGAARSARPDEGVGVADLSQLS